MALGAGNEKGGACAEFYDRLCHAKGRGARFRLGLGFAQCECQGTRPAPACARLDRGVGAGFALAAKDRHPESDVWLIYGDGAAGFSIMEFDSCARHGIGIIAVVGNDAGWTQIARDQVVILKDAVGTELTRMEYHVVAQGCGGHGILVENTEEIPQAVEEAIRVSRTGVPVLLNVHIGKTGFRNGSISM